MQPDDGITSHKKDGTHSSRERVVLVLEPRQVGASDAMSLRELLTSLASGKWVLASCVGAALAVAVAYFILATRWYVAEVTLLPAESRSSGGISGQLSGLTGVLGLGGLVNGGNRPEPLAVLQSRDFARQFIAARELSGVLAPQVPRGPFAGSDPVHPQSIISFFVSDVMSVSEDRRTGLIRLQVRWVDGEAAADWANELASRINSGLRAKALAEAESNIRYLQESMTTTSQVAVQQALGQLMREQMENMLLARGSEEFAFKVVDSAHEPLGPVSPQPLRVFAMALAAGLVLGAVITLARARNVLSLR